MKLCKNDERFDNQYYSKGRVIIVETMIKDNFLAGCRCVIDNGIEPDEVQIVLQALVYVMCDIETENFMVDDVPCCQSCCNENCKADNYHDNNKIHDNCEGFISGV